MINNAINTPYISTFALPRVKGFIDFFKIQPYHCQSVYIYIFFYVYTYIRIGNQGRYF